MNWYGVKVSPQTMTQEVRQQLLAGAMAYFQGFGRPKPWCKLLEELNR
jgi:hypothetical protein